MSDFYLRKYDYHINYCYNGIRARGLLKGIGIFKQYWYGRRVDVEYVPTNPRTNYQQANRAIWYQGFKDWTTFDEATKNSYRREGVRFKHSGINRWLSRYLNSNPPMIIYWGDQTKNVSDNATPDAYMSSDRFQGVQKLLSIASYPTGFPYGAAFYHSTLDKMLGLYKTGWKEMASSGGNFLPLTGGTLAGNLIPDAPTSRDLGSVDAEWRSIYLGDNSGINFGLDQDALLKYDEATDDRVELTGSKADFFIEDVLCHGRQSFSTTGADSSCTVTASYLEVTFTTPGDDLIISTTGVNEGDELTIVNVGSNTGQLDGGTATMKIPGGVDLDIEGGGSASFIFDGTYWVCTSYIVKSS